MTIGQPPLRVLVLGGTTEAAELARLLAGDGRFDVVLSLAGRTRKPRAQPVPVRSGGFGGVDGLREWLLVERIGAVVDATHPYAALISANAVAACASLGLPLASVGRPPWRRAAGDRWRCVASAEAAAEALGPKPRRVFLSLGRLELGAFAAAPQHGYLARLIEPPDGMPLPPRIEIITARGPFDLPAERELLRAHHIETIVSKNSGGAATYPKIEAARDLGIDVVMIARPEKPSGVAVESAAAAVSWLADVAARHRGVSSPRGV